MTDYIERPEHERIQDWRNELTNQRFLTLLTYKHTLITSLQVDDLLAADAITIELDRNGRNRLIRELMRANDYEDLRKANPE